MKIAVIGSINTDIMYKTDSFPKRGQTVFGSDYQVKDGGKGANQAVILNSLEKDVVFFGAIGSDSYAKRSRMNFAEKKLKTKLITKNGPSGTAIIQVVNGDNAIVVFKGANDKITKDDINEFLDDNKDIELIVSQLEINIEAVKQLIIRAKELKMKLILNPAPAANINLDIIEKADYIIPNETEAKEIFKKENLFDIVNKYKGSVVITMGDKGVLFHDGIKPKIVPAKQINVIDSTGAGDSFIAGFASGIAQRLPLEKAIEKGIKVASLTCQFLGAQSAHLAVKKEWKG